VGPAADETAPTDAALDDDATRKARGAFFTPTSLARYICAWAVRRPDDRVLEPSCGEAAFLTEAGRRQLALAGPEHLGRTGALHGIEVHAESARRARGRLSEAGLTAQVRVTDFFAVPASADYDCVVGNPPYIRYQHFTGASRAAAKQAALCAGVRLSDLASSWAAFTVHAAQFVRPGGRLGLVLPAELLSVNYAAPVRDQLMAGFASVRLVLFTERVFAGVSEEVLLLLADGRDQGPTDHCELVRVRAAAALADGSLSVTRWSPVGRRRWSELHLDPAAAARYAEVLGSGAFAPLQRWGETTLGMVTGANSFFAMTGAAARRHRLPPDDVVRISPPGSGHLRALVLTTDQLDELDAAGRPTWLFRPPGSPGSASRRYIREGQAAGVHHGYKCRVRNPWWRVPALPPADLLLTYMNADTPRLCLNAAAAGHLNSVHGVYLTDGLRTLGAALAVASLNSVTLLGAEVGGRSYGGGVLKLEPGEADAAGSLLAARQAVLAALRSGRLLDAVAVVDTVLAGAGGPAVADLRLLRQARASMVARRTARAGSHRAGRTS
jgi:hypothetical protein